MCKAADFNLSYESLTSHEVRQTLRDLPRTDPTLFSEISQPRSHLVAPSLSDEERLQEDSEEVHGGYDAPDDSDVPLEEVDAYCDQMVNGFVENSNDDDMEYIYTPGDGGGLSCTAEAEDVSTECIGTDNVVASVDTAASSTGRPKRMRRANVLYSSDRFESH